jgi:hypothetical protein
MHLTHAALNPKICLNSKNIPQLYLNPTIDIGIFLANAKKTLLPFSLFVKNFMLIFPETTRIQTNGAMKKDGHDPI